MEKLRNFKILKNEEETEMKVKWSLKKKLVIAGGALAAGVVGVFAYGKCHKDDMYDNDDFENEDDDYEEDDASEIDDLLENVDEDIETQE